MNNNVVLLPVILPMAAAILMMFFHKQVRLQRWLSGLCAIALLIASGYLLQRAYTGEILVFCASGWQPPYGITLVVDLFSAIMVVLTAIACLACLLFAFRSIDREREANYFYPVWFLLMMGVNGSLITGDIFNLFVFFEILLMASYVLMVLGNDKGQLRESFKYLILNVVSSAFFLVALAVLYGMMGTLNMADIAAKAALVENQGLLTLCAMIFMVVFGFKSAIFPIYFWLPKSYVEPPAAVSALFGGLLTKVGVYALVRVFTLIFIHDTSFTHTILLWIGGITMFLGVMAAVAQMNFKHILSSHIISQIGYMLMGLGIFTVSSIAGTIFFLAHNIIVKTALFLAEGATERITGTAELKQMGGLLSRYPVLGWGFFLAGISLAGVPPLSGFWGKLLLLESAAEADHYWMMAIAIIVGFFTLFSMMKIFIYVYWGKEKTWPQLGFDYKKLLPGCLLLVAVSIAMGLAVEPMYHIAQLAANQLMTPEQYIQAVLTTAGTR